MAEHGMLLLAALILDWAIGDPQWVWRTLPHPVAGFGKVISLLDKTLNQEGVSAVALMKRGAITIAILIIFALGVGQFLDWVISLSWSVGAIIEVLVIWMFIAQKSLRDHVLAVARAMKLGGIDSAREAVSHIVGRDPASLDESGIVRASIESLAENFGDGVVAPAFWYMVFGLPGLLVYKMINTADSMIAYRNEKYLHFGRATAQADDLANWLPARISAVLILIGGGLLCGMRVVKAAFKTVLRDAGLHRSPNAGWPESAMAGICNIALGGPRKYAGNSVAQAFINGTGKRQLGIVDITKSVRVFSLSCFVLWVSVLVWAFLF